MPSTPDGRPLQRNPMTGGCKILPDATIRSCTLCLAHRLRLSFPVRRGKHQRPPGGGADTRCCRDEHDVHRGEEDYIPGLLLRFRRRRRRRRGRGVGPVKRSVELKTGFWVPVYDPCRVVSGDASSRCGCSWAMTSGVGRKRPFKRSKQPIKQKQCAIV